MANIMKKIKNKIKSKLKYYYKELKIKLQLKNLVYGKSYMQVKKEILLIESNILIGLKEEESNLIRKLDFSI